MVRLREDPSAAKIAACASWRQADPEHERAWALLQALEMKFGDVPAQVGLATLDRSAPDSRRSAIKTLTGLLVGGPVAYLAWDQLPWGRWASDEHTTVGEQRSLSLDDGTRIDLNTATALDLRFNARERHVMLRTGEVLIETGPDRAAPGPRPGSTAIDSQATGSRPFVLGTPRGRIRAMGTRFLVRDDDGAPATLVSVLQGSVELTPAHASPRILRAGQQARFSESSISPIDKVDPHVADWTRGVLFADRLRLDHFLAEINRYRLGVLRCHPGVADLRLTGAFQLADVDAILATLPRTLPVRLVYRTRYWVAVTAAA